MVSNENIEIINNYTYLGDKFSANGTDKMAEENKSGLISLINKINLLCTQLNINIIQS